MVQTHELHGPRRSLKPLDNRTISQNSEMYIDVLLLDKDNFIRDINH